MKTLAARILQVVRPTGWAWLVVVVLAFVAGYGFGWIEAQVVAWAGLVVVAAALMVLLGRVRYNVAVRMPRTRVTVGADASATIVHDNDTAHRRRGIRVEVPVGPRLLHAALPPVAGHRSVSVAVPIDTRRRSVMTVGPARTVKADPLGLFHRQAVWSGTITLFVHPRIQPVPSISAGFVRDLEGTATRDLTVSDMAFHALRDYVPGDHPRSIHWRSSARRNRLLVRQFEQTRRSHVLVLLAGGADDFVDEDEFELAVSVCGSLGVSAIRDGRTTTVAVASHHASPGPGLLETRTPDRLLDDLSRLDFGEHTASVSETASVAQAYAPGASLAFVIAGSSTPLAAVHRASEQLGVDVETLGVACRPGAKVAYRRHASLALLTLGGLEDLGRAMARVAA